MDELIHKTPFHCIITGPTNCGKTKYLVSKLRGSFRYVFDYIILICPTYIHNKAYRGFARGDRRFLVFCPKDDEEIHEACKIIFNEGGPRSVDWEIASNGMPGHDLSLKKFPKGFRKSLGKTNVQINEENLERQKEEEKKQEEREQEQEKARKDEAANEEALQDARYRLGNLNEALGDKIKARKNASSHEEEDIDRDIARVRRKIKEVGIEVDDYTRERGRLEQATLDAEAQVVEGERAVENARERVNERLLSLRDRVKEIFKKHGFTVISVATAIAVVIGVIVSNLKAGLTKVAKGVGNGLKDLGKKLGEILPGMIGAIASFIFRTAGEVIGFLAKNAWLLIVGLVVLAVEQFKKKSR